VAWNLAQAKEHLEEIARRAADGEPQHLDIGGSEYVLVSEAQWRALTASQDAASGEPRAD
jgi:hypothetical protein